MIAQHIIGAVISTKELPQSLDPANKATITTILNIVFGIVASISVLIIVVSGLRYMLAHGDPNTTAQARSGILYAVVGLIITMSAYGIVEFVVRGLA
jgi:hypothetical protein